MPSGWVRLGAHHLIHNVPSLSHHYLFCVFHFLFFCLFLFFFFFFASTDPFVTDARPVPTTVLRDRPAVLPEKRNPKFSKNRTAPAPLPSTFNLYLSAGVLPSVPRSRPVLLPACSASSRHHSGESGLVLLLHSSSDAGDPLTVEENDRGFLCLA